MTPFLVPLGTHLPRLTGRFFPDLITHVPTDERVLYLTFDDGPTPELTRPLLSVLERYDAKATFFVVGENAEAHPDLLDAILDGGHSLGNHTFTHPDAWATPAHQVLTELERTTAVIEDRTGQPLRWMRPPYGRFTGAMRRWCQVRRQHMTLWDVMPGDYLPGASAKGLERYLLRRIRPGSIVVLHDNPKCSAVTPAALGRVLFTLRAEGWRFVAL